MFTGIVESLGDVVSISEKSLVVAARGAHEPWVVGESVAVNGCCLTVVSSHGGLHFDVSPETLTRTSLGSLSAGSLVNLERAMKVGDRFGGHIVQGHVDATGTVLSLREEGNAVIFQAQIPLEYDKYIIDKGSITVDGISLTVVEPHAGAFKAWIIPHTFSSTNLQARKVGDNVNLEFDVLARYVEKMLASHQ